MDRVILEKVCDILDVRQIVDPHNRKAGPLDELFVCASADTAKAVDSNSNVLPVAQIPILLSSGSIGALFRPPRLSTPPLPRRGLGIGEVQGNPYQTHYKEQYTFHSWRFN